MTGARLQEITAQYGRLRVAIVGDFCLDRYLEIDPGRAEISIETGLPVHNVVNVRSQPGAAGTILNNLVTLGIERIYPVGFAGDDGEGFELVRSLGAKPGICLDYFRQTRERRTFTYTKPLVLEPGRPPVELNRLDFKNWSATPPEVRNNVQTSVMSVADQVAAMIVLDQVDLAETGVITREVLQAVDGIARKRPDLFVIADSRRSLRDFPPLGFKMNRAEFQAMTGDSGTASLEELKRTAAELARRNGRPVFVSLAENGIVGAAASGEAHHVPSLPVRGEIDIVGAGDAVTANLTTALAAGATLKEALELAMLAASIVIHELGTTGTASVRQLQDLHWLSYRS
jgi:rfaE bifunctional protein kinase chain/domain